MADTSVPLAGQSSADLEVAETDELATLPARIVFFDGVCAFCDGAVRWLRERDPEGRFHFAPLQGETAARLRRAFPSEFPVDIDTLVYVERRGSELTIALRSEAVFRLCAQVGGGWGAIAQLRVLPRWLTDFGYRVFARSRYHVFGRVDACAIPSEHERARLLP